MSAPRITVIGGANGCGKSTLTRWARAYFQQSPILDPDALGVELRTRPGSTKNPVEAGRCVLESAQYFLHRCISFSVETTLSGNTYLRMLKEARELGYRTRLFYIGTESLDINLQRVRMRVLQGGHDVPEEDQRRRYPRSYKNLPAALKLAEEAVLFDNSTAEGHSVVAIKLAGDSLRFFEPVPRWAEFLRQPIGPAR